jgi:hypothetical protein
LSDRRHLHDESPGNLAGRAHAVTVISGMKPFWPLIHRILFAITALWRRRTLAGLTKLSFIYFAEWSYIGRVPPDGSGMRLDRKQMLFQSNFSGSWADYLDAFAYVIPAQTGSVWAGSYRFPGIQPATGFKRWAREHEVEAAHYYCAYPDATITEIVSALDLVEKANAFEAETRTLDDEAWRAAFETFLTRNQDQL